MLEWIHVVAIVGVAAAGLMTILWRGAASKSAASDSRNQLLSAKLSEVESALEKDQKVRQRQSAELAEFRKKADKSKRRGAKQAPQPMGTASRIQDLEEASALAGRERDRARAERDELSTEIARLRREIEAETRRQETEATAVESAAMAAANVFVEPTPEATLASQLAETRKQVLKLESERSLARQTEARIRKRMDNQELLYTSLRSELEVKKDRLRTQEEQLQRLQALKVAVLD